jgi:hypothetical protein
VVKTDQRRGQVVCRADGAEKAVVEAMFRLIYDVLDEPAFRRFSVAERIAWMRRCRIATDRGRHFRAVIDRNGAFVSARQIEAIGAAIERPGPTVWPSESEAMLPSYDSEEGWEITVRELGWPGDELWRPG